MKQNEQLVRFLAQLNALDENLRVATMLVFFIIASRPQGVTVRELEQATGLAQPAVNRAVLRLGSRKSQSASVGDALGLISTYPDPEESRRHLYRLNEKGEKFVSQVLLGLKT